MHRQGRRVSLRTSIRHTESLPSERRVDIFGGGATIRRMAATLSKAQKFLIQNAMIRAATDATPAPGGNLIVVGERLNVEADPFRLPPELAPKELDLDFLLKLGAFPPGPSRKRLRRLGLRWDAAINLLLPDRSGRWEDARADEVAMAIMDPLRRRFRAVVLLGQRVTRAFQLPAEPLTWHGSFAVFPHPSGRSSTLRDPEYLKRVKSFAEEIHARAAP